MCPEQIVIKSFAEFSVYLTRPPLAPLLSLLHPSISQLFKAKQKKVYLYLSSCICIFVSVSVSLHASIEVQRTFAADHFWILYFYFFLSFFLGLGLCPFSNVIRVALFWKRSFFLLLFVIICAYFFPVFVLPSRSLAVSLCICFLALLFFCFALPLLKHYLLLCKQVDAYFVSPALFFCQFQFLFLFFFLLFCLHVHVATLFGNCRGVSGHNCVLLARLLNLNVK